jgi:hypothetical protein
MALMRLMNAAGMPYSEGAPGDLDGGRANSLGKGEVVSSILTGSTIKYKVFWLRLE